MGVFPVVPKKNQLPDPALGRAIRALREGRGESREALAHRSGLATPSLADIELGRSNTSWATVREILEALEVSIGEFGRLVEARERE
jgi:transcriptional regulator with XRE-family HTH domain